MNLNLRLDISPATVSKQFVQILDSQKQLDRIETFPQGSKLVESLARGSSFTEAKPRKITEAVLNFGDRLTRK